jgi:SAM-dependent methyltransferase
VSRPPYDADLIALHFDEYGEAEWNRHEATPAARVAFHIHRHYLERFIHSNDRVLDIGAASGRFTVELARLGARITVADISQGQLDLNASHLQESGFEHRVQARVIADVVDLSRFDDASFDAVVCYGGPLSWVLDEADRAVDELLRVTKAGGHVLLGVMSLHGSLHAFLPGVAEEVDEYGAEAMQVIVDSGFLPPPHSTHGPLHLYTWSDLEALLSHRRCEIVAASGRTSCRSATIRHARSGSRTLPCGRASSSGKRMPARNPGRSTVAPTSSPWFAPRRVRPWRTR